MDIIYPHNINVAKYTQFCDEIASNFSDAMLRRISIERFLATSLLVSDEYASKCVMQSKEFARDSSRIQFKPCFTNLVFCLNFRG